jgi:cardiolipin synthase
MLELPDFPRWAVEVIFICYAIAATGIVVLERRHPSATLAWVLALIFVPVVGLLAYATIGRQPVRRHRKRRRRRPFNASEAMRQMANLDDLPGELDGAQRGLVQLALRAAAAPLRRAESVELVSAGAPAWNSLVDAIRGAVRSVHLEFYIWRDDTTGRALVELLAERASAGLEVRVLYDHLGSLSTSTRHFAPLVEAGGQVARFAALRVPWFRRSRANFRNHRKIVTLDWQVGYVGGLNVGDEYLGTGAKVTLWEDLFARIQGDAVLGLQGIFIEDWYEATGEAIEIPSDTRAARRRRDPPAFAPQSSSGPLVQIIPSGPDVKVASAIASQFTAAIACAQHRCWLTTPYFIPDEPLKLTLRTAALRGVDVRILLPIRGDVRLVALASRTYHEALLEAGCRIFQYPEMLHSKYLVIDDSLAALGSANMDVRSFYLNYEVTAMFYDAQVNDQLAGLFLSDVGHASELSRQDLQELSPIQRVSESFARVLSPLL